MRYGRLPGVDKPVSRIVLGSMIISTERLETSFALLDDAVACGITAIDTAHGYGGGNSERAIGRWLEARGNRDRIVIITKGCHHNPDRRRVTPYDLRADVHDSLARLRTDTLDCHLLHRDDPTQPVGPIVEEYNRLLAEGKVRAFGGSNWTHERLAEANAYAAAHGLTGMVASSPHFSLAEQVDAPWGEGCVGISGPGGAAARRWYEDTGMAVFPYSSLARGFFSGRVRSSQTREEIERAGLLDAPSFRAYCHPVNLQRLARVEKLAAELGVSVPQLALAYVLQQPMNLFPLVGAASRAEIEANTAALAIRLTPAQQAWLNLETDAPASA
jgi:aryl-alcohol dehydrogenase-like predicted oxidoreductase